LISRLFIEFDSSRNSRDFEVLNVKELIL